MIGISFILSLLALVGKGSWFLGLPLVPHEVATGILRPQSRLLQTLIHFFALMAGFFYCLDTVKKLLKREGSVLPIFFLSAWV